MSADMEEKEVDDPDLAEERRERVKEVRM